MFVTCCGSSPNRVRTYPGAGQADLRQLGPGSATAIELRYWEQDPAQVSADIEAAGEAAAVAFGAVRADQWQRRGIRSDGAEFTVRRSAVTSCTSWCTTQWDVRPALPSSGQ